MTQMGKYIFILVVPATSGVPTSCNGIEHSATI